MTHYEKSMVLTNYLKYAFLRTSAFQFDCTLPYLTKSLNNTCWLDYNFTNFDTVQALEQLQYHYKIIDDKSSKGSIMYLSSSAHYGFFTTRTVRAKVKFRFKYTDFIGFLEMHDLQLCDTRSLLKALNHF